jgi:hypothetical protein
MLRRQLVVSTSHSWCHTHYLLLSIHVVLSQGQQNAMLLDTVTELRSELHRIKCDLISDPFLPSFFLLLTRHKTQVWGYRTKRIAST